MKHIVFFIAALFFYIPLTAQAELNTVAFTEQLDAYNRIKPLQNPKYEKTGDLLKWNVIDRQKKIIGEVEDIVVSRNKGVALKLLFSFDRLKLTAPVYLNYGDIKIAVATNGYQLALKDTEITALYPQFEQETETLPEDMLSVRRLIGVPFLDSQGTQIGTLEEIFFGERGAIIQAAYVNINYGTIRNVGIALPFTALTFKEHHKRISVIISQTQSLLLLDYAKRK